MLKIYSNHCLETEVFTTILDEMGIAHEVCRNPSVYVPLAEEHGIQSYPFAEHDGAILTTSQLRELVREVYR